MDRREKIAAALQALDAAHDALHGVQGFKCVAWGYPSTWTREQCESAERGIVVVCLKSRQSEFEARAVRLAWTLGFSVTVDAFYEL